MKFLKYVLRLLPLAYMLLIWTLSGLPHNAVVELPDSGVDRFFKESLHLVEFGILHFLLIVSFMTFKKVTSKVNFVCALIAASYGILDEIHQSFIPYRTASWIDIAKDLIGVYISWFIVKKRFLHKK